MFCWWQQPPRTPAQWSCLPDHYRTWKYSGVVSAAGPELPWHVLEHCWEHGEGGKLQYQTNRDPGRGAWAYALHLVGAPPLVLDPADTATIGVLLPLLQHLLTALFPDAQSPPSPSTTNAAAWPTASPPPSSGDESGSYWGCPAARDSMALPCSTWPWQRPRYWGKYEASAEKGSSQVVPTDSGAGK